MKNEELKELGLDDDQIKAVQKIHGLDIEAKKTEIETLTTERDAVKTQLADASETIDGLEKLDAEGLKQSVVDWKEKAESFEAESEQSKLDGDAAVAKVKYDHAMKETLVQDYKVLPEAVEDVMRRLEGKEISHTDSGFVGLKESVAPMQESSTHLFNSEDDDSTPRFTKRAVSSKKITGDAAVAAMRQGAGLPVEE